MSEHKAPVYAHVGIDEGQVVVLFSKDPEGRKPANISQWRIDPMQCVEVSEGMTRASFEADTGLKPVGDTLKATLVEKHRDKLVPRITLMLHSMREDKLKSDGMIALTVIDSVFSEIFS